MCDVLVRVLWAPSLYNFHLAPFSWFKHGRKLQMGTYAQLAHTCKYPNHECVQTFPLKFIFHLGMSVNGLHLFSS